MKMPGKTRCLLMLLVIAAVVLAGCRVQPSPTSPLYSRPELEYKLIASFDNLFWCDPYLWPIVRSDQEKQDALVQFPFIQVDTAEFPAILAYLRLPQKNEYTDDEKLLVFREHNRLTGAIEMVAAEDAYRFTLRVGEGQGERIEGNITASGEITGTKREASINTCPICLTKGTVIETPGGPVPVEQLRTGMVVWTADAAGQRVPAILVKTGATPVPLSFIVVRVILSDGRTVTASPGHPTAEGKTIGEFAVGDGCDGTIVIAAERIPCDGGATFDILPGGGTGQYWANGILLKSTLSAY